MDKNDFLELSVGEQNWLIYDAVTNPEGKGIAGVFGPDRPETVQPKQPKTATPPGFTEIFGPEPDKFNSSDRVNWVNALEKFEGLIEIRNKPDYKAKADMSIRAGLGEPLAYKFAGQERICFEKKPKLFRPFSWYTDSYNYLVDVARNG